MNKKTINIYTDGSCDNLKTKEGSWAFLFEINNQIIKEKVGTQLNTTNNRMEYIAVLSGIKEALKENYTNITIYTDSMLLVNTMTKWIYGWHQKGWKKANGEIKNLDLIKKFWTYINSPGITINFKWVKGHSTNVYNNRVDQLASKGRKK